MKKLNLFLMLLPFLAVMSCTPEAKEEASDDMDNSTEIDEEAVGDNPNHTGDMENGQAMMMAMANIEAKSDSKLTGKATFKMQDDGKVNLMISVENAKPGSHAVHLHEKGDCSSADGKSAGGHWNPTNMQHGKRGSGQFHKGDIANMEVGQDGKGSIDMMIEGWSLGGDANSNIIDKAVVIHAGADDFTSQPSGDAGARVGCGVIKASN